MRGMVKARASHVLVARKAKHVDGHDGEEARVHSECEARLFGLVKVNGEEHRDHHENKVGDGEQGKCRRESTDANVSKVVLSACQRASAPKRVELAQESGGNDEDGQDADPEFACQQHRVDDVLAEEEGRDGRHEVAHDDEVGDGLVPTISSAKAPPTLQRATTHHAKALDEHDAVDEDGSVFMKRAPGKNIVGCLPAHNIGALDEQVQTEGAGKPAIRDAGAREQACHA